MAWYYGSYSCGHEGRTNVIGPVKDRQWKVDQEFEKLCPECWEKHLEEERERMKREAAVKAVEMELPELTGTEKQVDWAMTIRQQFIDATSSMIDIGRYGVLSITTEEVAKAMDHILTTKTQARWFIDKRHDIATMKTMGLRMVINIFKEAIRELSPEKQMEDKIYSDIRIESTVYPDNKKTNAVAEITFGDNYVAVVFEKNDDFRDIVKNLRYRWEGGKWRRPIRETTGSAEERAAELGNKLLNAGFPIMIMDQTVRENAVNGIYEPECHRWIYYRRDSKLLAINWDGYDDALYQRARSLPSAKWDRPSVVVAIEHYETVQEFARLFGFKFTKAAQAAMEEYISAQEQIQIVVPAEPKEPDVGDGLQKILQSSDDILEDLFDDA